MTLATILIEDSAIVRDSLIPALVEFADAEVIAVADTAAGGIAALEKHSGSWRLAVVDLSLREGNGLQVLRAVERRDARQNVIVLSNYINDEMRRRSINAGANAVFDKSTELEQFFEHCKAYSID